MNPAERLSQTVAPSRFAGWFEQLPSQYLAVGRFSVLLTSLLLLRIEALLPGQPAWDLPTDHHKYLYGHPFGWELSHTAALLAAPVRLASVETGCYGYPFRFGGGCISAEPGIHVSPSHPRERRELTPREYGVLPAQGNSSEPSLGECDLLVNRSRKEEKKWLVNQCKACLPQPPASFPPR
jgi:hypothetical protein